MKKIFIILILSIIAVSCSEGKKQQEPAIYDYSVKDINGNRFDFSLLEGKKIIVVNTASNCGFAKQYGELETLYRKYKSSGLEIVAFPSNDFNNLEPGSNEEIKKFCKDNYHVSFWLMEKSHVRGEQKIDVYKFLTDKKLNGVADSKIGWNFQKYLIDEQGRVVGYIPAKVSPLDTSITNWIERSDDYQLSDNNF